MQDFRRLRVWRTALDLTVAVYEATRCFPTGERFGLTAQLRAAAVSIGANIAEGCGRTGGAELRRFLFFALGSAAELQHHLMLAQALGFAPDDVCADLLERADHIARMLHALIGRLPGPRGRGVDR